MGDHNDRPYEKTPMVFSKQLRIMKYEGVSKLNLSKIKLSKCKLIFNFSKNIAVSET
jgi:hypothetical protein